MAASGKPGAPQSRAVQELWSRKAPPSQRFVSSYRMRDRLPALSKEPPARPDLAQEASLTAAADATGALLLYRHQGFVTNSRQQRAGGLAALELAQLLRRLVRPVPRPAMRCAGRAAAVQLTVLCGRLPPAAGSGLAVLELAQLLGRLGRPEAAWSCLPPLWTCVLGTLLLNGHQGSVATLHQQRVGGWAVLAFCSAAAWAGQARHSRLCPAGATCRHGTALPRLAARSVGMGGSSAGCRSRRPRLLAAAACQLCCHKSCGLVQVAQGGKLTVRAGASGDPSPHAFDWRDAMDVLVKWRQLSEPNDQVTTLAENASWQHLQLVFLSERRPPLRGPAPCLWLVQHHGRQVAQHAPRLGE